mmetsp:Transcript_43111/g.99299  ORF Transcript_43111/g.99299 Transcript_43111/m.99299 type:complete len:1493 (-) Transcript_43111:148-4626(-)
MKLRHPPSLARVQVLVPAPWKSYIVGACFVALYGISIKRWIETSGHAYERALQAEKLALRDKVNKTREEVVSVKSGSAAEKDAELEIDFGSLPSKFLPDPWTCGLLFLNVAGHVLFHMMCVWSVSFKAKAMYQPGTGVKQGCLIRVTPKENKGKAAICPVVESDVSLKCTFHFQYQTFEVLEPGEACDDVVGDVDDWGVRLIQCPVGLNWKEYRDSKGLATEGLIEKMQDKFGTNVFDLPQPSFISVFKAQLISPLVIFQFFCAGLWMLDTYWQYTCFNLFSIIMFEASTAFQRVKSMSTLRGMSTKSYNVFVYRKGVWTEKPIEELLPGDVVSLTAKKAKAEEAGSEPATSAKPQDMTVTVPCDALILRGSAIVNEATLTGESVPQMKDAVGNEDESTRLDIFQKHRMHGLFSGTSLIQATPPTKSLEDGGATTSDRIPDPPNGGIVCYVLRTGFNSSQGELMRMIEFSTQDVSADKVETALILLFLLVFALVAAGFVLKKGLEDDSRPIHKTLLRCTQIITSVVPPSLPMQMAFAVHTALMALLKAGIYCTEPFRVPYAGKTKYCFFDKTGTLTSDQMVAVAVVNGKSDKKPHSGAGPKPYLPVKEAGTPAAAVLSGCHSLIEVDGKNIGDPIEVAALKGIGWSYVPQTTTASPGLWRVREQACARLKETMSTLKDDVQADKKEKEELTKRLEEQEKMLKEERAEAKKLQVTIETRFHFSSELQRMSTLCKVTSQSTDKMASGAYCMSKGSPEAIGRLLESKPEWYDATYTAMAEKGMRVLALAYRQLDSNPHAVSQFTQKSRSEIEQDLTLAGFIAFKCETRKDTALVIKALQDSNHHTVMLTGDAPLTALSVAQEVGIATHALEDALLLSSDGGALEWRPAITSRGASASSTSSSSMKPKPFKAEDVEELAKTHDLVVPGHCLEMALSGESAEVRSILHVPKIMARLSPSQKEQIIQAVKLTQNASTMMCGDGGNDVGALREADVGIALLNGFGNANVGAGGGSAVEEDNKALEIADAEGALAEQRKEAQQRHQAISKKASEEFARKRRDLVAKQQQWVEEELQARKARGEEIGVMGHAMAVKSVYAKLKDEMKKEQELMQKKHGNAFAAGAAKSLTDLEGMDDLPMVQLGDASTAAPFTTRTPSIGSCVDIIRQGRCTLLSAVQQMQIMMMESMVAAYTMSAMSVDGTRPSQAQMVAGGILLSVASLAFSFARPVDRMHKVRPISSVFHPATIMSLLGQLAIHLGCMVYLASRARSMMSEEELKELIEFEKDYLAQLNAAAEEGSAGISEEAMMINPFEQLFGKIKFKNNLLNTCCWLVETAQQISVMFVNYKGHPWMKGMLENQPLFLSLFGAFGLVALGAWGTVPVFNETLNLVVIPPELRSEVMVCLLLSFVGAFIWDRLMLFIFAREIFMTMIEGGLNLTLKDFYPLLKTVGYGLVGLAVLGMQINPILLGLAYMVYRNYNKGQEANAANAAAGNSNGQRPSR